MRSFIVCTSPQAALWASIRESERVTAELERTRRALDDHEVEALATCRAEARRARRLASGPASRPTVHAGH